MKENYDFSKATKNQYIDKIKKETNKSSSEENKLQKNSPLKP